MEGADTVLGGSLDVDGACGGGGGGGGDGAVNGGAAGVGAVLGVALGIAGAGGGAAVVGDGVIGGAMGGGVVGHALGGIAGGGGGGVDAVWAAAAALEDPNTLAGLSARRKELLMERRRLANAIRNEERKRTRLVEKARGLNNADLLAIMAVRAKATPKARASAKAKAAV